MDNQPSLCKSLLLLLLLSLISSLQLIIAQVLHFNSVANLSTSWINNPPDSIYINATESPQFQNPHSLTPVLFSRSTNNSQFVCGLYCLYNGTANCLFGVLIYQSEVGDENLNHINKPQLIWSANRNHPVKINATLNFTLHGDVILKDADGSLVWSTSTSDKNVLGLKLTEIGNLVLYDKNNETVWQSFDHPTDSLLPGQTLDIGQKLTSSISASNWTQGLFSLAIQNYLLIAYIESNPPQKYFRTDYLSNQYVDYTDGRFKSNEKPLASATRFMRLEPDGHLKVFEWGGSAANNWIVVMDLLTSSITECGYPLVCGKYGICSNGQCSCLEEPSNETISFRQISYRQPSLGCSLATPISCNHSQFHSLLELKDTTSFNLNRDSSVETTLPLVDEKANLEDCKNNCLRNCSCKAALFVNKMDFSSQKGCLLLSEVFSLINNEGGADKVTVFLKVEKPHLKKKGHMRIIVGSSLGASFAALFLLVSCFWLFKVRNKEGEDFDEFYADQVSGMPTRFSYENLKSITSNFNTKLGQGGFGSVYEGRLDNGIKIAVKRLDGLGHIKKSFLSEVETIGSIHHVNLVSLIGFCAEKSERLLVYEYMSNGSLDRWIFQKNQELTLGWQCRRKIILDIAKGLAYLHEDCKKKIFHLDIKPQNILLDEDFGAKVSDFGLAKLIEKDQSRVVTTLRGTPGYLAPEWLSSIITEKVDVYSFGVVVLEILCGRKNIDRSQAEEEMHLLTMFKTNAEDGKLEDIVDKHEDMQLHGAEVVEMMKVAVWCLQSDFSKRPSMSVVVKVLEGSADVGNNLDYNFTNIIPVSKTATPPPDIAIGDATPLFPLTLSGPR